MRVFSVPVSVPLLRTVVAALIDGRLVDGFEARNDPERLAAATLYLPTRRAGRLAHGIFLDVLGKEAAILPRIVALGDIDEDELAFSEDSEPGGIAPLDVPPKLGELERRLVLARLVAAWAKQPVLSPLVVGGAASTLTLAGGRARLRDDVVTRRVDWPALDRRRQGCQGHLHDAACLQPSAICDACAAVGLRHQAQRRRNAREACDTRPRGAGIRDDAAVERHLGMA